MKIPVGISACVMGKKVRFDGGHKQSKFVTEQLSSEFTFQEYCPEMAIGMGTPRPTIRLLKRQEQILLVDSKDNQIDFTAPMKAYAEETADILNGINIRGYIVCKGSPTCGMERVKIYDEKTGYSEKNGAGLFTAQLKEKMPWLPIEEDGRLNDQHLRENFVSRVFALDDFYNSMEAELSRKSFVDFHSRYKLLLMAHNQQSYRDLGKLIANIHEHTLQEFFQLYRLQFMQAISKPASKRNHSNVLQHVQGYFKNMLDGSEKQELCSAIEQYRKNELPLMAPLMLLKHYLKKYPSDYLNQQRYFDPYPQSLKLRATI
jgi:uncharacterized protein YbgA (DUF1722 family)/uncharacterized protein YbbK (DUF523 family)